MDLKDFLAVLVIGLVLYWACIQGRKNTERNLKHIETKEEREKRLDGLFKR